MSVRVFALRAAVQPPALCGSRSDALDHRPVATCGISHQAGRDTCRPAGWPTRSGQSGPMTGQAWREGTLGGEGALPPRPITSQYPFPRPRGPSSGGLRGGRLDLRRRRQAQSRQLASGRGPRRRRGNRGRPQARATRRRRGAPRRRGGKPRPQARGLLAVASVKMMQRALALARDAKVSRSIIGWRPAVGLKL